MKIQFIKAGINDIESIIKYRFAFQEEYVGKLDENSCKKLEHSLRNYFTFALKESTYLCFIAKSGTDVVGIGGLVIRTQPGNFKNISGKSGYLMNMYTVPAFRRKGICSVLLEKLIDEARSMGVNAFELHATPEGEMVYKQKGFLLHGEPTYRKYL